jgi:hypothetical protein
MRLTGVRAFCLMLLLSGPALAQQDADVNTAYQFAAEGLSAFEAGSYAESLDKFSRAFSMVQLPSLALYMARANFRLGHWLAARELYAEAGRLPDGVGDPQVQQDARRAAITEAEALQASIPRLVIQVPGAPSASLSVTIDMTNVPAGLASAGTQLDPGQHQVTVGFAGQYQTQQTYLTQGESRTLVFRFQTEPAKKPIEPDLTHGSSSTSGMATAGWVTLAVGGGALALSGVTALWAVSKHRNLDDKGAWDVNHCQSAPSVGDCEDYSRLRAVSTVSFYTGAVGVATGVTLLLLAPKKQPQKRTVGVPIKAVIGAGYAAVLGGF